LLLVGCTRADPETRVARFAAQALNVPESSVRVTAQTELQGEEHDFYYAVAAAGPSLVVVVPKGGAPFDSRAAGAFDRVARSEQAAAHLSRLGSERVASWFGALGGGVCPPPPADQAHFVTVARRAGGDVELSYRVGATRGQGAQKSCTIALGPDGALRSARMLETSAPRASAAWRSDAE
jgi:hypothetical protein